MMLSFRDYLGYAERYLMLAEDEIERSSEASWLLIPVTILAWSAIESFVNNMLDDFSTLPEGMFELHERAFLLEKKIRFEDRGSRLGEFTLRETEYRRLADKIFFLIAKIGSRRTHNLRGGALWQNFEKFKNTRDALVHPRREKEVCLNIEQVERFVETSKGIIQLVSEHVWNKKVHF